MKQLNWKFVPAIFFLIAIECFATQQTTVTLTPSANPIAFGQKLTLTVKVTPSAATGTISFLDSQTPLGSASLSGGTATFSISTLTSGTHSITAYYGGDGSNYNFSASLPLTEIVLVPTTTTLAPSPMNSAQYGQPVTLSAAITPAPAGGRVTFYDGPTMLAITPVASGQATFATSLLPPGAHLFKAYYSGDSLDSPSASIVESLTVGATVAPANGFQLGGTLARIGTAMVVADFNHDGNADVAVIGVNAINVFLGDGKGGFAASIPTTATGALSFAAGDFDGDGKVDLAVVGGDGVTILLGKGDGSFQPASAYATGTSFISVAVGDFNGDGISDLVVGDGFGYLSIIPGAVNGTFLAAVSTGRHGYSPLVADFNNDGIADFAVNDVNSVSVLLGKGDNTFQAPLTNPGYGGALVLADFNSDGKPDIAGLGFVLLGKGDGTFTASNFPGASYNNFGSLVSGDFNGDGNPDLAIAGFGVNIFLGNGDGSFQSAINCVSGNGVTTYTALAVGDFNADGRTDLVYGPLMTILLGDTATQLKFTVQPTTTTAGATMSPVTVQAQDVAFNNVIGLNSIVTLTSTPAAINTSAALSTSTGSVTFSNIAINTAGPAYTLTAAATGLTSATSNSFTISPAGAKQLAITTQPVNATPSTTTSLVVQVQDQYGNVVTTSTAPVTVTSTPSGLTPTMVNAIAGVATFNTLSISTPGTYTLSASSPTLTSATSNSFAVLGPAVKLAFSTPPTDTAAGATIPVVVQVQDSGGNVVTSSTASITLTSTPAGINVTIPAVNGVATFTGLTLNTPGSYTLAATSTGLTAANSPSFNISAGTAAKIAFTTQPVNGTAGTAIPAVVAQVQDQFGNPVTGSTASITLTSTPTGINTTVAAVNGVATFTGLVLNTAGSYTLTAASTGLTSGTSSSFTIAPTTASKLAFGAQLPNATAGTAMPTFVVQVQDQYGNVVTGSTASVGLTSTPAGLTLSVTAASGVATVSGLVPVTAGSYTLTAASTGLTSATSNSFTVGPGAAAKLAFPAQPPNGNVGTALPALAVQVQDANGNVVTTSTALVTITSTPAAVNTTATAANGVATFSNLTFSAPGSYILTATSTGLANGISAAFPIVGTTTVTLVPSPNPSILSQNVTLTATVAPATATGTITFKDGSGTLGTANLANGAASLTISAFALGSHSLTAVYAGDTYDTGSTSPAVTQIVTSASYTISGKVTMSGAGLSGVTVALTGSQTGSMITDSRGGYNFTVGVGGNYTVTPTLFGYNFTPPSQTFSNVTSNQTANFTAASAGTFIVYGQVTAGGAVISGVTINVVGSQTASTTTDLSGNYFVTLVANGNYTISASRIGYSFSAPLVITNLTSNQTQNFTGIAIAGLAFYPVTPCRLVDTRVASFQSTFGPPSMSAGTARTFNIPANTACGIPSTAAAYSLNVTVVTKGYLGYLSIWPTGQPMPNVSTLNSYATNSTAVANAAIVPAGTNGAINVFATDGTDLILDIDGYFAAPSQQGLVFYPVTPCRLVDTRVPSFQSGFGTPTIGANMTRTFPVPNNAACQIPATAQAYSVNVTAVPQKTLGFLSIWPTGKPQPNVSTLNVYTSGTVVANAAIVPAGTNGAISAYVTDQTDLVIDINGYFAPQGGNGGLKLYPVIPCRVADTRVSSFPANLGPQSMGAQTQRSFPVPLSNCGIPNGAGAYSFNFTAVPQGPQLGIFTTWPTGLTMPNVSTMNSYNGSVVANAAIEPAGTNGAISIYVTDATDVLFDINGYFAP